MKGTEELLICTNVQLGIVDGKYPEQQFPVEKHAPKCRCADCVLERSFKGRSIATLASMSCTGNDDCPLCKCLKTIKNGERK